MLVGLDVLVVDVFVAVVVVVVEDEEDPLLSLESSADDPVRPGLALGMPSFMPVITCVSNPSGYVVGSFPVMPRIQS